MVVGRWDSRGGRSGRHRDRLMRTLARRVSPLAHIVASVVVVAFGTLGITNANHTSAKVVYGVLIAVGLLLVMTGVRRHQRQRTPD